MKKTSGFSSVAILGLAIIIMVAGIALYGYFQSQGKSNLLEDTNIMAPTSDQTVQSQDEVPISESDDTNTLQEELDASVIVSPDSEFDQLEQEVGKL